MSAADGPAMSAPLIFCHYGNSDYLRYTLNCARRFNPDKQIILLGDASNQWLGRAIGITHRHFSAYDNGKEIALFQRVFRPVEGREFKGGNWLRFSFKKWFLVHSFLNEHGIDKFWHVDSDNMIVTALHEHESKFDSYDCTEQCQGICMKGFITNRRVVNRYVNKINELFQRENYLAAQQREFDQIHPKYAFTEMRAYETFKVEERIRSLPLNTIIDDSTFDQCLCVDDGMMRETLSGKTVKKVLLNPDGRFFTFHIASNRLIQLHNLNLSYLPSYVFPLVMSHASKRFRSSRTSRPSQSLPSLSTLTVPWRFRPRLRRLNSLYERVSSRLGIAPELWARQSASNPLFLVRSGGHSAR